MSARSPAKLLLSLGLLVFLIHLALLGALPVGPTSFAPLSSPLSFVVRTVERTPSPVLAPKPEPAPERTERVAPTPKPVGPTAPLAELAIAPQETPVDDRLSPEEIATIAQERLAEQVQTQPLANPPLAAPPPAEPPANTQASALAFDVTAVPESVKLVYEVHTNKFPFSLNGELLWRNADARYKANLTYGLLGQKRSQSSTGKVGRSGLIPDRFSDKYRSEVAAHFNWEQDKVTFSANTPDAPLQRGAQDRLSIMIQIAALMASTPTPFAPGSTLSFQTVGPRSADVWLFAMGASEKLDLPGGTLDAVKLTRERHQTYDQQLDIWVAPALGYLPARLRITEANGDYVDQQWLRSGSVQEP